MGLLELSVARPGQAQKTWAPSPAANLDGGESARHDASSREVAVADDKPPTVLINFLAPSRTFASRTLRESSAIAEATASLLAASISFGQSRFSTASDLMANSIREPLRLAWAAYSFGPSWAAVGEQVAARYAAFSFPFRTRLSAAVPIRVTLSVLSSLTSSQERRCTPQPGCIEDHKTHNGENSKARSSLRVRSWDRALTRQCERRSKSAALSDPRQLRCSTSGQRAAGARTHR